MDGETDKLTPSVKMAISSFVPYMLLYGYALENMIKALLIGQGINATIDGRLNEKLKKHKLKSLVNTHTQIKLGDDEKEILDQLTEIIEEGKYPIGVEAEDEKAKQYFIFPEAILKIHAMLNAFEKELYKVCPDRALEPVDVATLRV
jgi:hypothetical protein